jgi:two-component system nitrogen regulation response regulator GlnG
MPSGTILLADDDAAIRTVLNQALGRVGYEVR